MNELFLGFYLGIFFTILLANILVYFYNKEKSYLYYFLMHLGSVLLTLDTYGVFETSRVIVAILMLLFSFLFVKEFLNLNSYYPAINRIFILFILVFTSFLVLLYLTNNEQLMLYIPYSFIILSLVLLGVFVYQKGYKLAIYFIAAWGVNYIFILLGDLHRIFELNTLFVPYLSQIGNLFEAIILFFALFAKTKMLQEEKIESEKMLIHQSRLASMGEMLANISHQWRQPLNRIASFVMNMQLHIMDNYKEEKFLSQKLEDTQEQLEYMSHTIDDFTTFYQKDKIKEEFLVSSSINNALSIVDASLKVHHIKVLVDRKEDFMLNSYPKELAQVILNLLHNAKDALIQNKIENPTVTITVEKNSICIADNGIGIKKEIENKIFEPYFSTKEKSKSSGLGLYMSKLILEQHLEATIKFINSNEGASFLITFRSKA